MDTSKKGIGRESALMDAVARALLPLALLCGSCRTRERPQLYRSGVSGRHTNGATSLNFYSNLQKYLHTALSVRLKINA